MRWAVIGRPHVMALEISGSLRNNVERVMILASGGPEVNHNRGSHARKT